MYRDDNHSKFQINCPLSSGGLGDNIARLPCVEYLTKYYPHILVHLWVPDYFVDFAKRSISKGPIIRGFSENKKYKEMLPGRTSDIAQHTNLAYHMTDHGFNLIVNKQVEDIHKDYLPVDVSDIDISKFNLPEKYVVICTGYTSPVREFYPEHVNAITKYLVSKGYTPVFLGKTETFNGFKHTIKGNFSVDIDYDIGINLIDQTSLLETTKIIYGATTIVGMDNGLLHIGTTHPNLPIVGGFSTVEPKFRMAYRNGGQLGYNYYPVTPYASLACRFCQSNMILEFGHTFLDCFYKDFKCLGKDQMGPDKYIAELEKILK